SAVSDNLANAQTTGFNAVSVEFAALIGEFIGGNPLGGGVGAGSVRRDFSQGSTVQTSSPTDMAIEGNGFFVFQDAAGNTTFSRNGAMSIGNNGNLLAFNGSQVLGYGVNSSGAPTGVLSPIVIPQTINAPSASTKATLSGNLNASSPVISKAINPNDPTTYSSSMSVQVYDSLGNAHTLTFFFQNSGKGTAPAAENWNWTATLDGSTTGLGGNSGTLGFDANGNLVSGGTPTASFTATPAGAKPLSLSVNFSAITQYGSAAAVTGTADGRASGQPKSIQVDNTGLISVTYSNGNVVNVGKVAIATFAALQGLQLTSGGVYQQTIASGAPTISTAEAGSAGSIQASALEGSNVDTTQQLVSLVALQRSYEANAKALQTSDNMIADLMQVQTAAA
ncbi:MAG: flagellar hook protein FlgE, partial [Deltaproteobacteria bacterium]|nr:flagellar hook protein FlgE [Deltaproteobacteria bacterium]